MPYQRPYPKEFRVQAVRLCRGRAHSSGVAAGSGLILDGRSMSAGGFRQRGGVNDIVIGAGARCSFGYGV